MSRWKISNDWTDYLPADPLSEKERRHEIQWFLDSIYYSKENGMRGLDFIFENIDKYLYKGWFDVIDGALATCYINRCSVRQLLTILTATLYKQGLPSRPAFYERVAARLEGNPEKEGLLGGLE